MDHAITIGDMLTVVGAGFVICVVVAVVFYLLFGGRDWSH